MRCYALLSRPDGRMNSLAGAPVGLAVNVSIKMLSNLVCNTWLIPVLRFSSLASSRLLPSFNSLLVPFYSIEDFLSKNCVILIVMLI